MGKELDSMISKVLFQSRVVFTILDMLVFENSSVSWNSVSIPQNQ